MVTMVKERASSLWTMTAAFFRLSAVEDFAYPLSIFLTYFGKFMPVFIYYFIAQLVPARDAQVGGDYFTFILVGLSVTIMLDVTLIGFGKRLQLAWERGYFEALLVTPVTWAFLPFTMHIWEMCLGLLMVGALLVIGVLLGAEIVVSGLLPFIVILLLGVMACVGVGLMSAALQVLTKKSGPIVAIYSVLATMLAGAVFPLELLPGWLRPVSYLLPHTYVVSMARNALMPTVPTGGLTFTAAVVGLVLSNIVFFTGGMWLFRRTLEVARRQGMLGQF